MRVVGMSDSGRPSRRFGPNWKHKTMCRGQSHSGRSEAFGPGARAGGQRDELRAELEEPTGRSAEGGNSNKKRDGNIRKKSAIVLPVQLETHLEPKWLRTTCIICFLCIYIYIYIYVFSYPDKSREHHDTAPWR